MADPYNSAPPAGSDIAALIATIPGAVAPSGPICDQFADAAWSDFQLRTGRYPFLASGTPADRRFDPPDGRSGRLIIDIQSANVVTVTVGVTGTDAGTVLTENVDYELLDSQAPYQGKPYEQLRFFTNPRANTRSNQTLGVVPRSIVINADWGWGPLIPADVWLAVCKEGAANALEQTVGLSGPLRELKQGTLEQQYGIRGTKTGLDDLHDFYEAVVGKYVFVPVAE